MRKRYVFRSVAVSIVAVLGSLVIGLAPAFAGGPIVYNQRGGSVPMYGVPSDASGVQVTYWLKQSSRFNMICYVDQRFNSYGNYWSNRWFYGQTFDGGHYGYVHSSWVYYQWTVRRC